MEKEVFLGMQVNILCVITCNNYRIIFGIQVPSPNLAERYKFNENPPIIRTGLDKGKGVLRIRAVSEALI